MNSSNTLVWMVLAVLALVAGSLAVSVGTKCTDTGIAESVANLEPLPDLSQAEVDALVDRLRLPESEQSVKELVPGWERPTKMLVFIDRPDRIEWLQDVAPGVELVGLFQRGTVAEREAEALPHAPDADAFVNVFPNVLCNANVIRAAKELKWLHSYGAGVGDCIAVSLEIASGKFLFTNSQKLRGRWVAENIFAMMVSLARGVDLQARMNITHGRDWMKDGKLMLPDLGHRGVLLEGRTLLVVGLGGIGTELARMAHGIGMKVIATRHSSRRGPDFVEYVGLSDELPDLIAKADVVAMTAPLTSETEGMFNAALFNRMKTGALFVSVSREDVVVKQDLINALESGQVGAAGMNANTGMPGERAPLQPNEPLWSAPNMLYITHNAAPARPAEGYMSDSELSWQIAREQIRRYVAGEKMLSVVDVERGY